MHRDTETVTAEGRETEDPETGKNLQVKKGKVLWHSKDRDEVYRKARELRPKHSAILYTGKVAEDAAVVL